VKRSKIGLTNISGQGKETTKVSSHVVKGSRGRGKWEKKNQGQGPHHQQTSREATPDAGKGWLVGGESRNTEVSKEIRRGRGSRQQEGPRGVNIASEKAGKRKNQAFVPPS